MKQSAFREKSLMLNELMVEYICHQKLETEVLDYIVVVIYDWVTSWSLRPNQGNEQSYEIAMWSLHQQGLFIVFTMKLSVWFTQMGMYIKKRQIPANMFWNIYFWTIVHEWNLSRMSRCQDASYIPVNKLKASCWLKSEHENVAYYLPVTLWKFNRCFQQS